MIIVSDNTATNLIIDRISADAVNDYLDSIGIHQTRSNRKVRGDGTKLKEPTGWSKAGLIEDNKKYGLGVSTPKDMVHASSRCSTRGRSSAPRPRRTSSTS